MLFTFYKRNVKSCFSENKEKIRHFINATFLKQLIQRSGILRTLLYQNLWKTVGPGSPSGPLGPGNLYRLPSVSLA